MDSIFELLEQIRQRPTDYISKRSIHCLKAYVDGWCFRNIDGIQDGDQFGEFVEWIEKKYKVKSSQGWAKIIEFWSEDEFDALNRFFELLFEFQQKNRDNESQ